MKERMKEIRRAIRSGIDAALLFPIRLRYPGGVVVGMTLTQGIRVKPTGKRILVRGNRFIQPDA